MDQPRLHAFIRHARADAQPFDADGHPAERGDAARRASTRAPRAAGTARRAI